MKQPPVKWYRYRNRIISLVFTFIFTLLWMWLGFGKATLIVVITAIGYLIGSYFDGELDLDSWLNFFIKR